MRCNCFGGEVNAAPLDDVTRSFGLRGIYLDVKRNLPQKLHDD